MSKDYKKACLVMQREPLNPIGSCFDSVAHNILMNSNVPKDALICHGIGVSNMPGQEGEIMAHAWIECEYEGIKWAADTTWDAMVPAAAYREKFFLNYVCEYTQKEFMENWQTSEYPGPWDSKIKKVINTKKGN
jgi:hypothetical protein